MMGWPHGGGQGSLAASFGEIRSDYAAARASRFRRTRVGLPGMGAGADYHYRSDADYLRIMEYARDMDRNDVAIGRLLDTASINTLQGGMGPDIDTGDVIQDKDVKQAWEGWADSTDCTLDRKHSYAGLEYLSLRSVFGDGDILLILTEDGDRPCIQPMEAHRLRTPQRTRRNIRLGVQRDDTGKAVKYWFTREDVDGQTPVKLNDMVDVAAYDAAGQPNVLHIIKRKRLSQTRGMSALAPIIDTAGQFEDIQFATLVQRQIVSCLTFIRTRSLDFSGQGTPPQIGPRTTEAQADGSNRVIEGLAPGMEIFGAPGETITPASPQVPNTEYFPHVRLTLTLMTINLGVPLCIFLLDGSETNFSGWRGAVDQARIGWRVNQRIMIEQMHRQVWNWWIRQFMARNADVRGAITRSGQAPDFNRWATWNPPGYPYIQPMEDAKAFALRIETNQNSLRREHADKGSDWDAVSQELVDDRGDLVEKAIIRAEQINSRHPDANLSWRELVGGALKPLDVTALDDEKKQTKDGENK